MTEWRCVDPMLCTYQVVINGNEYYGQRTLSDTVALWHNGDRLGTYYNLEQALLRVKELECILPTKPIYNM